MFNKLDVYDVVFYKNMSMINDGLVLVYMDDELELFCNGLDLCRYFNMDW